VGCKSQYKKKKKGFVLLVTKKIKEIFVFLGCGAALLDDSSRHFDTP
jgi:hypothetical protein